MESVHRNSTEVLKNARMKATGTELSSAAGEGNILVAVPAGIKLISPAQLNTNILIQKFQNAQQQGGRLAGIDPTIMENFLAFMSICLDETAVLPDQKGSGTATSSSGTAPEAMEQDSGHGTNQESIAPTTTLGMLHLAPNRGTTRQAPESRSETGTGEAEAKQPKDDGTMQPVPAEQGYDNLG